MRSRLGILAALLLIALPAFAADRGLDVEATAPAPEEIAFATAAAMTRNRNTAGKAMARTRRKVAGLKVPAPFSVSYGC